MTNGKRITAEVMAAETRLRKLQRDWAASTDLHQARWMDRQARVIAAMSPDIVRKLIALEVLTQKDVDDAQEVILQVEPE